jgi:SAM-dependent methyltransferase
MRTIEGDPQQVTMTMTGGDSALISCLDYLSCSRTEQAVLNECVVPNMRVLDYGCGAGRHLQHVRTLSKNAICTGIEINAQLRKHCRQSISQSAVFHKSAEELDDQEFDLILLLGNGLGIFGAEKDARRGLAKLCTKISQQGILLIEAGNPFGTGYISNEYTFSHDGASGTPFLWGSADQAWLTHELGLLGFQAECRSSGSASESFFIAKATRIANL